METEELLQCVKCFLYSHEDMCLSLRQNRKMPGLKDFPWNLRARVPETESLMLAEHLVLMDHWVPDLRRDPDSKNKVQSKQKNG